MNNIYLKMTEVYFSKTWSILGYHDTLIIIMTFWIRIITLLSNCVAHARTMFRARAHERWFVRTSNPSLSSMLCRSNVVYSSIVATRFWSYLNGKGELQFIIIIIKLLLLLLTLLLLLLFIQSRWIVTGCHSKRQVIFNKG